MMFAPEPASAQAGRQGGARALSPFSPSSPMHYSPMHHEMATSPSPPVKMEAGGYYPPSPTPLLKLEPMSPSSGHPALAQPAQYARGSSSGGGCLESQPSPCPSSLDSLPPFSPVSGVGASMTAVSSPLTSPLSPSSTPTLSPSSKIGHDDLSSPSLSNSFSSDPNDKKKKGAVGRQTEELCLVCGDRASGYHYNALTCEGCKGFFRRSITKKAVYNCKYGKSCVMDMYMRRKCQECRFTKCMTVGMRPECVVPEHTCRVKRKQKQEKNSNFTPTQDVSKQQNLLLQLGNGLPSPLSLSSSLRNCDRMELTKDQQELISRIINSQEVYESPIEPVTPSASAPRNQKNTSLNYSRIMDMTEATIQLIVKFATKLPGFLAITQQDQITLLKEASGELLLLRASRRYHVDTDTIVFADNTPCTREFYMTAGMNPYSVEILFNFCKKMATMKVDNAEYGLLSAIILFSERPALTNSSRVQKIQYLYVETLCAYVTNKAPPNSGMMVAKLLDVLTQLRTLVILTYEECEYFLSKDMPLPDLLKEMWDITNQKTQNFDHSSLFLD